MDSDSEIKWKPFSLTHVEYPEGDSLGKLLAIASLFPIGMIVGAFTLMIFRRDLHTITFFIGNLFSEVLNLAIKKIVQQPRPLVRAFQYSDYGMPSSHSQISWFFATYTILFVIFRLHHNQQSVFEAVWKATMMLSVAVIATIVMYSRVYLLYHSWAQVFVGSMLGIALGFSWFALVHLFVSPLFPTIASTSICELLMVRDTSLIPNIMWFEYTNARNENRTRNRKVGAMKSQ